MFFFGLIAGEKEIIIVIWDLYRGKRMTGMTPLTFAMPRPEISSNGNQVASARLPVRELLAR